MIGKYIGTLLTSRTQAHILHLQTRSYAKHKALNKYYDEVVDLIDGIVESYQGAYGIIENYENVIPTFQLTDEAQILQYFELLDKTLYDLREQLPQDSYLQNQFDTVCELLYATIYKLKYLN